MPIYDDLETFFRERGIKQRPDGSWWEDSYDYGVWWFDADRRTYRLTWVGPTGRDPEKSGELYLVRLDGPTASVHADVSMVSAGAASGRVEFLCRIPPTDTEHMADENVEKLLEGWAEVCGTENSVAWVRDRAWEAQRLWGEI